MQEADGVTFTLAALAYALLSASATVGLKSGGNRRLAALAALVAVAHVCCVWAFRYGWALEKAIARGYGGAVLFHGALALMLISPVLRSPWGIRATLVAWGLVSAGALGAVFRFESVAWLRAPIIAVFVLSAPAVVWGLLRAWRLKRA
jgi:hypothetical protein